MLCSWKETQNWNTFPMSYSKSAKDAAYRYIVLCGYNPEQTANALRADYPKITSNTVRKWMSTKDKLTGNTWEEEREEARKSARKEVQKEAQTLQSGLKMQTLQIIQGLRSKIMDDNGNLLLEPKSAEGGIYALLGAIKRLEEMEEKENKRFDPVVAARQIYDAILATPDLNQFLKKHPKVNEQFLANLRANLDKISGTKEIVLNPASPISDVREAILAD